MRFRGEKWLAGKNTTRFNKLFSFDEFSLFSFSDRGFFDEWVK